jgi:hypothetical protein
VSSRCGANLTGAENIWRQFDQVVCPSIPSSPLRNAGDGQRKSWKRYNQERLGDLIDAGWDLIICDEAHRLGGSTEQVARYQLGKALAEAAPYCCCSRPRRTKARRPASSGSWLCWTVTSSSLLGIDPP